MTMASVQRPSKLSMGPAHPDPIVETASLSAVQPPEPTYKLQIAEQMEALGSLSCLQLETIVYACQVTTRSNGISSNIISIFLAALYSALVFLSHGTGVILCQDHICLGGIGTKYLHLISVC